MSYEIIRSIRMRDGKVFIASAPNNVRPITFETHEAPRLSGILSTLGLKACEIEILKNFEEGNFQSNRGSKYADAIDRLREMPEYKEFDWRTNEVGTWEKNDQNRQSRKKELEDLLWLAYTQGQPTGEYDPKQQTMGV